MNFDKITDDNFLIYASKHYSNVHCNTIIEFNSDLKLFSSVRLSANAILNNKSSQTKSLLNSIITLTNLFGNEAAVRLLFVYCKPRSHNVLATYFMYLGILPKKSNEVDINKLKILKHITESLDIL